MPYDQRVDSALQKLLASRQWSTPQRQWLQRIAAQTKANMLVDREALDDPDLVFRREGGGFAGSTASSGRTPAGAGHLQRIALGHRGVDGWC